MVDKRHSGPSGQAGPAAVPLYGFQPPVGTPYGLEVSTVEDFFAQHDDWPWNPPRPGRATFHYLIAVTEGELRHDVDHVTRTVAPGQWLWVRPGHAQCWHPPGAARGPFILFEPDVLRPDTRPSAGPAHRARGPCRAQPAPRRRRLAPADGTASSWTNTAPWGAAPSTSTTPCGAACSNRCCCAWPTPRASPPIDARPARAALTRYATASWTPWSCTSANCTRPRTTPSCSAARSAPSAAPPRTPPARGYVNSSTSGDSSKPGACWERARWDARAVAAHLGFTDPANFGRFFRDRTGLTPAAFAAREARTDA